MKKLVARMVISLGLLGLCTVGLGCDSEPRGSCIYKYYSGSSLHDVCESNSTPSTCTQYGGTFKEDGDCILFDLFHPPT